MKATRVKYWMAALAAALTATAAFRAAADQPATAAKPERSYTGTVVSVNPNARTVSVKEWPLWKKTFNLGENCTYALLSALPGKNQSTANDLRPGEKVTIRYQDSHGVLIADRIEQQPMRFVGRVAVIDPGKHTLIMHRPGLDKKLAIANGCVVVLYNGKPGTFADLQPDDHVTVTYEMPGGMPTAREIAQTSLAFTGKLTAIDLGRKTVEAKALLETKKFNVPSNCAIVINGRPDGKLSDLKPDEQLVFTYDEINGVNVVNRIGLAPAEVQSKSNMMTSSPGYPGNPGY